MLAWSMRALSSLILSVADRSASTLPVSSPSCTASTMGLSRSNSCCSSRTRRSASSAARCSSETRLRHSASMRWSCGDDGGERAGLDQGVPHAR